MCRNLICKSPGFVSFVTNRTNIVWKSNLPGERTIIVVCAGMVAATTTVAALLNDFTLSEYPLLTWSKNIYNQRLTLLLLAMEYVEKAIVFKREAMWHFWCHVDNSSFNSSMCVIDPIQLIENVCARRQPVWFMFCFRYNTTYRLEQRQHSIENHQIAQYTCIYIWILD